MLPSRRLALIAFALPLFSLVGCGPVKRPDGGEGLLAPGMTAPDVVGVDAEGREVSVAGLRGKLVVVYFYPRDGTPGCTKEACAFRDAWQRLQSGGVHVLGVSTDSPDKHRAFQEEHGLPFALASDESGAIGRAYGVSKKIWGYDRVTFLVARDGRVARVWPSVDPGIHATEIIAEAERTP
jgi:thioredoxin-dependent peroxiredoxin